MTDLNTNQYLYNQPYHQTQTNSGDNKGGFPTSYDDKRLDPVKENLKANPIGKVVSSSSEKDNKMNMPILLALGAIPTFLMNKACKNLIKGNSFKDSLLGKLINKIDAFSNTAVEKVPALKFDWAKNAFERVKNGNGILSQIINAKSAQPVWSMAKGMVAPTKNTVLKELLEEATSISKQDPKAIEVLIKALDNETKGISQKAYNEALKLAGKNSSEKFIALRNRAQSFININSAAPKSVISKFLNSTYNSVSKIFNIGKMGSGVKGKIGPMFGFLMTAYFLGQTVKNTIDAPKGEKTSTLAHGVIVDFTAGWLMFEPLTRFMYKGIGALKTVEGKGISKLITKPLGLVGKVLNTGLNMTAAKSILGKSLNAVKGIGGGVGRFALMMMVLFPIIDKMARFVSHNIFGKPNALLAKEKAEEEEVNTENNTDALKKALEQNKAGMLTVDAKNPQSIQGSTNSMIEQRLKEHAENINKPAAATSPINTSAKISDVKPDLSKNPFEEKQKVNAKQQYIPSDTRKISQEDAQKKAKFDETIAATDSVIREAEKALSS